MITVIMCTWKRVKHLKSTLEQLSVQTDKDFKFVICNNNNEETTNINDIIKPYKFASVVHNEKNLLGFGRFVIASTADTEYVAFFDDDQIVGPDFIKNCKDAARPKTLAGFWSWKFTGQYHSRRRVSVGEDANYLGTGGMVADTTIFKDIVNKIPDEFKYIEDLWMSYYAKKIGWAVKGAKIDIDFGPSSSDENSLYRQRHVDNLKRQFTLTHYKG